MKQKGFTLIELLIVIAIIGVLASVVLASLNSARSKGADAAIKSNLTSIRVQAAIWYEDNGLVYASTPFALGACPSAVSTGNIFADSKVFSAVSAAYNLSGGVANSRCVATADEWAVAIQLKTSDGAGVATPDPDSWCTDSVGSARSYAYASGEDIGDVINNVTYACN